MEKWLLLGFGDISVDTWNIRVISEKRNGTPHPSADKMRNLEPMSSTVLIDLNVQTMLRHMMVIHENMDKFEKSPCSHG